MKNEQYDVIIVGAGLAGLSCGLHLVDEGLDVLILEGRDIAGGRTASWDEDGMAIESGFHRYLGFYEAMPALLKRAGVTLDDIMVWTDEAEIRLPDGKGQAVFGLSPVHNFVETIWGVLANNQFIDPVDKARLSAFFVKGFYLFETDKQALDRQSVAAMAAAEGVSAEAIHKILVPLTEGLFFLPIKQYSALNFFALFAPYLTKMHKMRVGAFNGGMSEVMIDPLVRWIEERGGEVRTGSRVTRLLSSEGAIRGVAVGEQTFYGDALVLAASLAPAQALIGAAFPDEPFFAGMLSLETMPSVTVQVELRSPASRYDRVIFTPGTSIASCAEESRTTFPHSPGRLSTIMAQPEKMLELEDEALLELVLRDAPRVGLDAAAENVLGFRVVSWPDDFYSYSSGTYDKRPSPVTPIFGLYLAGDYTKQEYLQTMEGAVYSGQVAAEMLLKGRAQAATARARQTRTTP